jgi:hypothetical protein
VKLYANSPRPARDKLTAATVAYVLTHRQEPTAPAPAESPVPRVELDPSRGVVTPLGPGRVRWECRVRAPAQPGGRLELWLDGQRVYEGDAPEDWVDLSGEYEAGPRAGFGQLTAAAGGLETTVAAVLVGQ